MSRVKCKCGEVVKDVESPCPSLVLGIPDEKLWPVIHSIVESCEKEHPTDLVSAVITDASTPIYRCSQCGRLLVFWNGGDSAYSAYRAEVDLV